MTQSGLLGAPSVPGSVTVVAEPGGTVLRLAGEVDTAVVQRFDRRHGDRPEAVAGVESIDASTVTFIDLAGLRLILRCAQRSAGAGRPAVLRHSSPQLDRMLRLTDLGPLIPRPALSDSRAVSGSPSA